MSNSTNVEKNKNPKKLDIIAILDNSKRARIFFLIALGISGLGVRLYFFPVDVPLFGDSQGYFWYAIDTSILNQFPTGHNVTNNGWPIFLSVFFQLIDSNDFLDYQNAQRLIGVIFSIATIFPVYLLCTRFFKKSYSLLGAALFIFEPRLIQNSSIGTPESMYIFLLATLLFLFLSDNFKKIYLAFLIVGLLSLVRYEGLILIIPLSVVFFIRFRTKKINIFRYLLCLAIFSMLIIPVGYMKNETMGQDGFVSHISAGPEYYQTAIEENISTSGDFLKNGIINMGKYLGWIQLPFFIIFVPLGVLLFFKNIDYKKITIISIAIMILIPAFYAYSRDFSETKYLYALFPIFSLVSCLAFKKFFDMSNKKNLIFCLILIGIIFSSVIFVDWKAMDIEHYRETYQILVQISDRSMVINSDFGTHGGEFTYFHWTRLHDLEQFPDLKKNIPENKIKYTLQPAGVAKLLRSGENVSDESSGWKDRSSIDNLEEYLKLLKEQKVTHLLLDEVNHTRLINNELRSQLSDVFANEQKYAFLIKEYDSKDQGFQYHLKLFRINYEE